MSVALSPRESDEPLMGLVASYIRELDVSNKAVLLRALFGYDAPPLLFLPSGLNHVARETADYLHLTAGQILSVLTSFHYVTAYADAAICQRVRSRMMGDVDSVRNRLGLGFGRFTPLKYLRYCPECFREDREARVRLHWRRSHQLPGVAMCHKHQTPLFVSKASAGGANQTQWPCAEDPLGPGECISATMLSHCFPQLQELASRSASLLGGENSAVVASGADCYRAQLKERGFGMGSSQMELDSLSDSICEFYGSEYLRWCGLYRTGQGARDWLVPLLCKGQASAPTVAHLLLQVYLGAESVDNASVVPNWPICPSRFARHGPGYRVKNIGRSSHGEPCLAHCECGMIFRFGVCEDSTRGRLIVRHGQPYTDKIIGLAEEGLPLSRISELTGVNRETVRLMVKRGNSLQPGLLETELQALKDEWAALVSRQSGPNPCTAAHKENRRLYRRLMLRDREWMTNFRQSLSRDWKRLSPADWHTRDQEYLVALKAAAKSLLSERPVRWLSVISVLLVADVPRGVRNQLQFLPTCQSFLNEVCEDRLEFYKRRLRIKLDDSRSRGCEHISPEMLLAEAGMSKSTLATVLSGYARTLINL